MEISLMEDESELVKTWLKSMVGKTIAARVVQKASQIQAEHIVWRGRAKVVRCVEPGVVLELHAVQFTPWFGGVFRFFRNIFLKHVVSPWERGRVSIPYHDLDVSQDPQTGEKWLIIDSATWNRSPEELTESAKNAKGERRSHAD
ncbi:MAG: hypothetical protein V3T42_10140 [Nitrospirales bacterium]